MTPQQYINKVAKRIMRENAERLQYRVPGSLNIPEPKISDKPDAEVIQ